MQAKLKNKNIDFFVEAFKIALGSCISILIADKLELQYSASAGITTLLTLMTMRKETFRLAAFRLVTFAISIATAGFAFVYVPVKGIGYGIYLLVVVFISLAIGWRSTISVNAVIGTHFLTTLDFSLESIRNEILIVIIGSAVALVINLFGLDRSLKKMIEHNKAYTEEKISRIMQHLSEYVLGKKLEQGVWDEIIGYENELKAFIEQSHEYRANDIRGENESYVEYFDMRREQITIFHALHYEIKKIRSFPQEANIVSDLMKELMVHLPTTSDMEAEMDIFESYLKKYEEIDMPTDHEDFHNKAILFHILMDLGDCLVLKRRYVDNYLLKQA